MNEKEARKKAGRQGVVQKCLWDLNWHMGTLFAEWVLDGEW